MSREIACDLLVVGGGLGGYAAALAALKSGLSVVLSEEGDRLGGQLTAQAVPPDEHPWIEQFGSTASYRQLRRDIRQYYRHFYPLTAEAASRPFLNPGDGFVSAICHEPEVARNLLEARLRPYVSGQKLQLFYQTTAQKADCQGDKILAVTLKTPQETLLVTAKYFLEATETGDLLPLVNCEFVTGAESQKETGEPHALAEADPLNQQAISHCFVIDYHPDRDLTIEKPEQYDFWRNYLPPLTPSWGGPLLSWQATHPITLEPVVRSFNPLHPQPERGPMDLWTFRRLANRANFQPGTYQSDIVLVNWPQIDYLLGPIVGVSPEEKAKHLHGARQLSLSMMYWMQTEAPREDGGTGWKGLGLRPDITGTADGLAAAPYIRESRRIRGLFTVREQDIGYEALNKAGSNCSCQFFDTVGIGAYRIDLHPSTRGNNYIDVSAMPFQIPLGALIPQRLENLLAGGKSLAVTHITNGCYRLHPVEWSIGEAAGLCCAFCIEKGTTPRVVRQKPQLLQEFQKFLEKAGVELYWPKIGAM